MLDLGTRRKWVVSFTPLPLYPGERLLYLLSRVGVTYKTGFGLHDGIYCAIYIHTLRDYRQYSAIAILHTLQFTVAYSLGVSVSPFVSGQRIYHSLTVTSDHISNSFLAFLQLPIPQTRLISNSFSTTVLYFIYSASTTFVLPNTSHNYFAQTPWKTPSSIVQNACPLPSNGCPIVERLCCGNVFTDPLPSNEYTRHNIHIYIYIHTYKLTNFRVRHDGFQSRQKVKHGHESREAQNQEGSLCWRGPTAI
jgi:hypothetical protein